MPVADSDILVFCAENMPEDNSSTSGGSMSTTIKAIFTDIAATDSVKIVSSNAADTSQVVTIVGRDASGAIVQEDLNLNGTTLSAATSQTFERILKIEMDSSALGTVTVSRNTGGTTIATLEPGLLGCRRLFYNSSADASGGSSRSYYEKVFIYNSHNTLSVTSAVVIEESDPSTLIEFDLESSKDGNNSVTNRLNNAPTSMLGSFSNSNKSVPSGSLGPSEGIGVWLRMVLPAGQSPSKNTYNLKLTGTTT